MKNAAITARFLSIARWTSLRDRLSALVVFVFAFTWTAEVPAAAPAGSPHATVQQMLNRACAECHGDQDPEGDLQLLDFTEHQWGDYGLLDEMLTQVEEAVMPPEGEAKQFPTEQRKELVWLLETRLKEIEETQLGGTLVRLTRREWCDTLYDLTGVPVAKPYQLPVDSSHAMTRLGEHQLLTPLAMRQYQELATRYADRVILDTLPEVREYVADLSKNENQIGNTSNEAKPYGIRSHNDRTNVTLLSPVKSVAQEGVYEFTINYYHTAEGDTKEGLAKGVKPKPTTADQRKHFGRFTRGGEILNQPHTHDLNGEKLQAGNKHAYYRFDEPLRIRVPASEKFVIFTVGGGGKPSWIFESVKVRGPIGKEYPASHEPIFGDAPRDGDLAACRHVLDSLATRLFRRSTDAEIMAPYYAIAETEYEAGGNLFSATKLCFKAMVCSPFFLFKEAGNETQLTDRMIATRLSYFLWNSMPDERLANLAADGKLADPVVRRAEADRLLTENVRSQRFVRLFLSQWLGLDKYDDFAPNAAYTPREYALLREAVREEPYAFFTLLCDENLSARNLIDSDFVVWNRKLAEHYGSTVNGLPTKEISDGAFAKVSLTNLNPKGRRKDDPPPVREHKLGGLVSMPIIMSMTTDGETTQPMLRGAWVVKHLLGLELEPPDTVPALEIDLSNVDKPKDILRLHKQDPSCYSCHVKMDYMGLALENFDVMGRWTPDYKIPVVENEKFVLVTKGPVDALAEAPGGKPVEGVAGLKKHLLQREDEVIRNLTVKLFAYAHGREVRYNDRPAIDQLMKKARENDYRLRDIILEIVASKSFAER